MSNEYTEMSLQKFRARVESEKTLITRACEDLGTLMTIGAIDSFVQTFTDDESQLFGLLTQRLIQGDEPFSKQTESSSDPLEYTDNNGCTWLFDPRKPHLGWV